MYAQKGGGSWPLKNEGRRELTPQKWREEGADPSENKGGGSWRSLIHPPIKFGTLMYFWPKEGYKIILEFVRGYVNTFMGFLNLIGWDHMIYQTMLHGNNCAVVVMDVINNGLLLTAALCNETMA